MLKLTQDNFEKEVLQAEGNIFVYFSKDGWPPCGLIKPFLAGCEEKYSKDLPFAEYNVAEGREITVAQGIKGFPTTAVYVDGKMVESTDEVTYKDEGFIESMIKRYI